jgi:hypothetical protein
MAQLFDGIRCADDLPRCPDCGAGYERFNSLAFHRANECKGAHMARDERKRDDRNDRDNDRDRKRSSSSQRAEFLKPGVLSRDFETLTIGGSIRTFKSDFGIQLVVSVKVGGRDYDWGLKINGGAHIAVEQQLGRNLLRWEGKTLQVRRGEWEDRDGNMKDRVEIEGERPRD